MDSVIQNNEEKLTDVMQLWAAPVGEGSEGKDKSSVSIPGQDQYSSCLHMTPGELDYKIKHLTS